jgi:hypothetical protein
MKEKYRIVTNGNIFRIQKKLLFFYTNVYDYWDAPYDYKTYEEAQNQIDKWIEKETNPVRWKPV